MIELLITAYMFLVGACFGSFAGAAAWRLHKKRSMTRERSECEHCHHVLGPLDLIPIVSWLWLGGKCRYCKKPIGYSALVLELASGTAFAVSFLAWPYALTGVVGWTYFIAWLAALILLLILFVYDMRHFLLPNALMYPLIAVGGVIFCCRMLIQGVEYIQWPLELGFGLVPIAGLYWLLYTVSSGKWVGFGDVRLGVFMGLVLGWQGALLALVVSNLLGVAWTLPGLLSGRLKRSDAVPFGPFLIAATFIVALWGTPLINSYTQLFLL